MVSVLFVCMGNICRSPLGEGIFRYLAVEAGLIEGFDGDFKCASAGIIGYHVGNSPDPRSQLIAETVGIDISNQRSQKVKLSDFEEFDYIIAMDQDNLQNLQSLSPKNHLNKISLLLGHSIVTDKQEVPDPYYVGEQGFQDCLDLVTKGSEGLLGQIMKNHFPFKIAAI